MKKIFLFLFLLGVSQSSFAELEISPSQVYTFGDSYSDTGNQREVLRIFFGIDFPPDPPYFDGHISNGLMWIEHVAAELGLTANASRRFGEFEVATNFSEAGSITDDPFLCPTFTLPCLRTQIDFFINNTIPTFNIDTSTILVVVFGGANDSTLIPCDVTPLPDCESSFGAIRNQAKISAQNIGNMIRDLNDQGVIEFLVPNSPGFILADPVQFTPQPIPEIQLKFAIIFNFELANELRKIEQKRSDINITQFNSFRFFLKTLVNPGKFGLTNTTEPCVTYTPLFFPAFEITSVCNNPEEHFFFDALHPSSTVHALWGEEVIDVLLDDDDDDDD